jgi:hypothetical protein
MDAASRPRRLIVTIQAKHISIHVGAWVLAPESQPDSDIATDLADRVGLRKTESVEAPNSSSRLPSVLEIRK